MAIVTVSAVIAPGWHLYSLVPTPPPGPTATTLMVPNPGSALTQVGHAWEDKPVVANDLNFGKPVAFHEGRARFMLALRVNSGAGKGAEQLPISLHYQVCNDRVCLPPTTQNLTAALAVDAGPARPEYANAPAAATAAVASERAPQPSGVGNRPSSGGGLLAFALAAFGGGLLALLTPCVFPLIPVTFGFFTKQAGTGEEQHRRLIGLAGAYALGIVISFTALGLVAALVFGAAGANRVAANPWFNLFFGLLFVAFAFSFFESFLIQLPPALSRFARPAAGASGLSGVLLMGLAFVFAAFTCTAPFIGTVLVAASSATGASQWARPVLGMICFALALALPFFLLALFPGLLARLPRSGGWMTRFKATLGFVELAYALTYFSKADLVWQAHILTQPVIFALWAVLAVAAALYLLGLLRVSAYPEPPARLTPARGLFAALFGFAGVYCLYALTGRPVNGLVLAYLPPTGYGLSGGATSGARASESGLDAGWLADYQQALAQARESGKPVFIDFTGYTCTNCRYVEQNVFTKQPVEKLLANDFTRLRLYTDGGKDGPVNQAFQQKMFGTVALPLYAVVSPDGRVAGQLSGSGNSVAQFAAFLTSGERIAAGPPAPPSGRGAREASWGAFSDAALAQAKASARPVIVDFTASWCTNCHALEKNVFTAPPVAGKIGQFTTLRADLTDFYGAKNAAVEKRYSIAALPAVLFFGPDGREAPGTRVTGLVSASDFAARMDRASGSPGARTASAQGRSDLAASTGKS